MRTVISRCSQKLSRLSVVSIFQVRLSTSICKCTPWVFCFYSGIRFNSWVEGSWIFTHVDEGVGDNTQMMPETLACAKTDRRHWKVFGCHKFEGADSFDAPIFHSKDFAAPREAVSAASKSGFDVQRVRRGLLGWECRSAG